MKNEKFPTESHPHSPPEHHANDEHGTLDRLPDQSDTSGSFLQDGGSLLAENLGKIASEHGPEAVRDYLKDILTDTEGKVPSAERAAAFTLLAEHQKQTMRQEVIHVGDQMDTTLEKTNADFTASIASNGRVLRNTLGAFSDNANVMARGRITVHTQESSLSAARSMHRKLDEITDSQTKWASTQRAALDSYRGALVSTMTSETRLRKTSESLTEDYDGEPIDASTVIRGDILTQFATELHNGLTAEGTNPAEVITRLLDTPEDEATLETIHQYKNYVDEYSTSLNRLLGNPQTDLKEPTEMIRRYMRDQANVPLGGSLGREQATIAALENSPRQIANNANRLNGKRQELRKHVQAARGNNVPKPTAIDTAPAQPETTTPTHVEATPATPVENQTTEVVTETAPEPAAETANEQVQESATEIIKPAEVATDAEIIEDQHVEQDVVTEPIPVATDELPIAEPEVLAAREAAEEIVTEVPEIIEATAPKISRIVAADKAVKDGVYSLRNLPPEPIGKVEPKPEPKLAGSPYVVGYTQTVPRQQTAAERQFSAPGAEAKTTEDFRLKRPAHIRREAAEQARTKNPDQPGPRIHRSEDNRSTLTNESLYNFTQQDVDEMRKIIARQAAEAAKRQPNQPPAWIQTINNPVSNLRKSREERLYESRAGRFLINLGNRAVRAGRFLRKFSKSKP